MGSKISLVRGNNFIEKRKSKSHQQFQVLHTQWFNRMSSWFKWQGRILSSFRWPDIGIADYRNYEEEQVILLVSDPQLQGYQMEPPLPIGAFSRWDIDRYLTRTFGLAYNHVKPDIILFLGDLIDEGSTAVDEEYHYALQRFTDVFSAAQYTKKIFIPGDNDIGGEGRDFRTQKKVDRFVKSFENITGVTTFGFIDYIKVWL
ncbi:MPPE1 [Mytilus coruscus]|uniref:MPPE1 n=1 Tax=Mytilus coruscus TaxID=42192 RepID=A0A6J8A6C9_MYTCO|nr:MPPE1 [Mytilus coruscus]